MKTTKFYRLAFIVGLLSAFCLLNSNYLERANAQNLPLLNASSGHSMGQAGKHGSVAKKQLATPAKQSAVFINPTKTAPNNAQKLTTPKRAPQQLSKPATMSAGLPGNLQTSQTAQKIKATANGGKQLLTIPASAESKAAKLQAKPDIRIKIDATSGHTLVTVSSPQKNVVRQSKPDNQINVNVNDDHRLLFGFLFLFF